MNEFLGLVSSTLQSYLAAYSDDLPSEESEEAQFILALCGVITSTCVCGRGVGMVSVNRNLCVDCESAQLSVPPPPHTHTHTDIAASAYGRDYLAGCESGRVMIDMLCSVLANAPNTQSW